jgi:hypothetical protein
MKTAIIQKLNATILVVLASFSLSFAQIHEVGGGLGFSNNRSDVSNHLILPNTSYGFWGFYRYNFNPVWVLRAEIREMHIQASDNLNFPLPAVRNYNFNTNILEFSINAEYNFLNYRKPDNQFRWCPFLTLGVANFMTFGSSFGSGFKPINLSIPFGFGVKYKLSEHLNLGSTFIADKTFTDNLDGLSSNYANNIATQYQGIDLSTNDWYFFLGFSISYTFYKVKCPEIYDDLKTPKHRKNKK